MLNRFLVAIIILSAGLTGYIYINKINFFEERGSFNVYSFLDEKIPFIPMFIFIYFLLFPYILTGLFTVKKNKDFFKVIGVYFFMVVISFFCFYIFKTKMIRPNLPAEGFLRNIFFWMWKADVPGNCAPSLHVSSSVFTCLINIKFYKRFKIINIITAFLISISTLLVKQHAIIDVVTGALLAFIMFTAFFTDFGKDKRFEYE